MFFNYPTQVKYFDDQFGHYKYGIAYHDEIIRAIDGKSINVIDLWDKLWWFSKEDLIIPLIWTDMTKGIHKKEKENEERKSPFRK